MDKNSIFTLVQQYTKDVPLILIGTGGTIPYGIPGMGELANHLKVSMNSKFKDNPQWIQFIEKINKGVDLETALTDINLNSEILNEIIRETWILVNSADIELLKKILKAQEELPLATLIKRFYTPNPQCINIITTNYDRVIEYACDQVKIPTDIRFCGNYFKSFNRSELSRRSIVNLIKVHGSLDMFRDSDGFVYSIPLQMTIPEAFTPEIITPGNDKYRALLISHCADLKRDADNLIDKANSFLCIGYGFNDNQIQRNIIEEIKKDKPIVVITKQLSNDAIELIKHNSKKHIIIQNDTKNDNTSHVVINGEDSKLDGIYWSIDGFLKII